MPYKDPEQEREKVRRHRRNNLAKYAAKQAEYYRKNPNIYLLNVARSRAKKLGVPFGLTKDDIVVPETCPVLGIPLFRGTKPFHDNSPSMDRFVPALGYVAGNVAII